MSMNLIDISGWQNGLNLEQMFNKNPNLHGAIMKATEGTYYVCPNCDPWVQVAKKLGRPWGFYHFLSGGDPIAEAEFFYKNTSAYFHEGIPVADYEAQALSAGTGYLKRFLDKVYDLSGVKPLVYTSLSVVQGQDFRAIANAGYRLWLAQYANMQYTGIQENPWQSGSVTPFNGYIMHQYASTGRLSGWGSNLDLDKFMGTLDDWKLLANGDSYIPGDDTSKPVTPEIVADVMAGKYGIGDIRRMMLVNEGYNYDEVQGKINELYSLAEKTKKAAGMYLDVVKEYLL